MAKRYRGHKPKTADWEHIGTIEVDGRWLLYVRPDPSSEWSSVKVVAEDRACGKANYWLGWNGHRFSRQSDLPLLLLRDGLAKAVEVKLKDFACAEGIDLL